MPKVDRLINYFKPEHYSLTLSLHRTERRFEGTVIIDGTSANEAESIALHTKDLTLKGAKIDGHEAIYDNANDNDEVHIAIPVEATGMKHTVEVTFEGHITDPMHGLYPSVYEYNGVKKELLATQFESHHAREVFPCIDEPEAKATFDLTLNTETGITALGNMPVEDQREQDERLITTFERSPRMSTYLLAFVTGELHCKEATTKGGTAVRVWTTPNQDSASLDFALETATRCIDFFNDYFGVPYPLPKSDHVALPDFSSGAMENWGLITYREVCLLVDPKDTSVATKEFVALVICHELSHQWFGNLVTMKWWDDLWLNESFACLMEYVAVDALFPDWDIWTTFASHEALGAMRRDALPGVQPVKTDVSHPDEIATLFDSAIVYAKGARLLFMLFKYIGDEAFRTGLTNYFKTYPYSNTAGSDLWSAFAKSSGKDVASFMDPWLQRPGYPLISVDSSSDGYVVKQRPFVHGDDSQKLWPVPIFGSSMATASIIVNEESTQIPSDSEALQLNSNAAGYYTVRYEDKQLARALAESISSGELPAVNRLLLLNDSLLQARAGISSAHETLQLLEHYSRESNEPVWDMIGLIIADLRKIVEIDKDIEDAFKHYVRRLIDTQYQRLGWEATVDEPLSDTKLRSSIIGLGVYSEDEDIIDKAKQLFAELGTYKLPAELRATVLAAVVRYGDSSIKNTLLAAHDESKNSEIRQDIVAGLTATKSPDDAKELLALITKEGSMVRLQDADRWFIGLLRNRYTRDLAWQWMKDQWPWIEKNFGGDKSYEHFPRYAALIFSKRSELEQYQEFFTPLTNQPALQRTIKIGINDITSRVEWGERDIEGVKQYLLAAEIPA